MSQALLPFLEHTSYFGLFLILLCCGLGLPLPEDIPLLVSGWLVHRQIAHFWPMIAAGMLGVLSGDLVLFSAGRRFGESILEHRYLRRIVSPGRLDWAERQFTRRGTFIIFAARFMPGARSVLFLTAGIFGVSRWKFLAIDGFAAVISVPVWIWLGAKFGRTAERVFQDVRLAQHVVFATLALLLAAWIVWELLHRRRIRQEEIARALTHPPHRPDPQSMHVRHDTREPGDLHGTADPAPVGAARDAHDTAPAAADDACRPGDSGPRHAPLNQPIQLR